MTEESRLAPDASPKIMAVCLSATIQRTVTFRDLNAASVNRSEHYRMDASGKAVNAARVIAQLAADGGEGDGSRALSKAVKVVCPLGKDNAEAFLSLARRDALDVDWVKTPGRTRECWTLLDRMRGTTTEIVADEKYEEDEEFPEEEAALLEAVERNMAERDAVLLAGSKPAMWSAGLMAYIARMARDAGKFLLADYHGEDLERTLAVCTPSCIKINKEEFCQTFSLNPFVTDDLLLKAVADKSRELKCMVIVTQGLRPTLAAKDGETVIFPVESVKAVNTTACGDSFAAGFLYEYLESGDFNLAIAKGTWCAARNAEREQPGAVAG